MVREAELSDLEGQPGSAVQADEVLEFAGGQGKDGPDDCMKTVYLRKMSTLRKHGAKLSKIQIII